MTFIPLPFTTLALLGLSAKELGESAAVSYQILKDGLVYKQVNCGSTTSRV